MFGGGGIQGFTMVIKIANNNAIDYVVVYHLVVKLVFEKMLANVCDTSDVITFIMKTKKMYTHFLHFQHFLVSDIK